MTNKIQKPSERIFELAEEEAKKDLGGNMYVMPIIKVHHIIKAICLYLDEKFGD